MIDTTFVTFAFPPDPAYLPDHLKAEYRPGDDIDLGEVYTKTLTIGDTLEYDGYQWQVAQVQTFDPIDHAGGTFRMAIATLDGKPMQRKGWNDNQPHLLYCLRTETKALNWGMPAKRAYLPGEPRARQVRHEILKTLDFVAADFEAEFDLVRVALCEEAVAAIAA